jgi:hypothetical protein
MTIGSNDWASNPLEGLLSMSFQQYLWCVELMEVVRTTTYQEVTHSTIPFSSLENAVAKEFSIPHSRKSLWTSSLWKTALENVIHKKVCGFCTFVHILWTVTKLHRRFTVNVQSHKKYICDILSPFTNKRSVTLYQITDLWHSMSSSQIQSNYRFLW